MLGLLRALAAAMLVLVAAPAMAQPTAVDAYVARRDPAFAWRLEKTIRGEAADTYVLELTSQTWRSAKDVDRPTWTHWLTIVKPDRPKKEMTPEVVFITMPLHHASGPRQMMRARCIT